MGGRARVAKPFVEAAVRFFLGSSSAERMLPAPRTGVVSGMRNQNSVRQVRVPIGALKPYENHPRQHNRQQRRKIRRLIENIGAQLVPVIVTPDLMIIDGLALWETMRDL